LHDFDLVTNHKNKWASLFAKLNLYMCILTLGCSAV